MSRDVAETPRTLYQPSLILVGYQQVVLPVSYPKPGKIRDTDALTGNFQTLLKRWQDARVPLHAVPATVELGEGVPVINASFASLWLAFEGLNSIEFKMPVKRPRPPAEDR